MSMLVALVLYVLFPESNIVVMDLNFDCASSIFLVAVLCEMSIAQRYPDSEPGLYVDSLTT